MRLVIDQGIQGFCFGHSVSGVSSGDYHLHDNYEIFYLRSGKSEYFIKDQLYSVDAGSVLFIPKQTIHKNCYLSAEYERTVLNFSEHYIDNDIFKQTQSLFRHHIFIPTDIRFIQQIFSDMHAEWDRLLEGDNYALRSIRHYLNILLLHFIRNKDAYMIEDTKITNPSIGRLIKYINKNFQMPISLKTAAQMLNLTPAYLSALFIKNTGLGFKDYLCSVRIKQAKIMLRNTAKPVYQIADESGFNDSNYFSTAFKTVTGMSPTQYRRQNK